jgi:hypothetical protein
MHLMNSVITPNSYGLVVRVPGYGYRGPGSISGATRFSGTGSTQLLERKSSGSGLEIWDYSNDGSVAWLRDTSLSAKVATNFADKQRLLSQYSLLMD